MGASVEKYLAGKPEALVELYQEIRSTLLELYPLLEESIKYGTPFYTNKGQPVCYMTIKKKVDYVEVSFVKGFKLSDYHQRLVTDNRSIVRGLRFWDFDEAERSLLLETIYEAIELE